MKDCAFSTHGKKEENKAVLPQKECLGKISGLSEEMKMNEKPATMKYRKICKICFFIARVLFC